MDRHSKNPEQDQIGLFTFYRQQFQEEERNKIFANRKQIAIKRRKPRILPSFGQYLPVQRIKEAVIDMNQQMKISQSLELVSKLKKNQSKQNKKIFVPQLVPSIMPQFTDNSQFDDKTMFSIDKLLLRMRIRQNRYSPALIKDKSFNRSVNLSQSGQMKKQELIMDRKYVPKKPKSFAIQKGLLSNDKEQIKNLRDKLTKFVPYHSRIQSQQRENEADNNRYDNKQFINPKLKEMKIRRTSNYTQKSNR